MILNWQLVKHPANWVIVLLMLVIAGIAGHLALTYFGVPASKDDSGKSVPDQITPATSPVYLRSDGTFQAVAVN